MINTMRWANSLMCLGQPLPHKDADDTCHMPPAIGMFRAPALCFSALVRAMGLDLPVTHNQKAQTATVPSLRPASRSRPIKFYDVMQLSHTSRFRVLG
jgi:hypothetical protein